MNATTEHLRSELERLFELDELKAMSTNLLGLSPDEIGGTGGKGTFARALVEKLAEEGATAALLDAMVFTKKGVKDEASAAEDLAANTVVDGWKIGKKLGEGGVGITYAAEKNGERAALKVVRFVHARDKGASRRWLVAQRALSQLDGKDALGKVLGSGVLPDGRPWVATSYIEGQLLGARIARTGPMHFNEARPIVRGVLSGLETLHARGLAHGNVKMENVFVVRPQSDKGPAEPSGVLVDAAADRLVARNGAPSNAGTAGVFPVAGSAKAIAPEHARLGKAVPSADVYAVGTLLYEVLTGKQPFSGESAIDVLARHLTTDPEAPSVVAPRGWVSKDLDAIILKALAKSPSERYASAAALREALEGIGRASIAPEARKKEALDQAAFDKAKKALLDKPADEELAATLERISVPAEEWKLATDTLVEASGKADEKDAKKALLFRAARLLESDAQDHAGAEGLYKQILELDGEDEIARAALEELKRQTKDAEGLVELLLEKVEREKTAHDRAAVLREIADTYETALSDEDNAYVAYVQALSEDPRHETTVSAIERLAKGKNERWNEAIGALNEAVAAAESTGDKVAMFVLMGRWYADELGRPDFALPCYSQAISLDPASEPALDGTVALYRKAQSYPELAAILLKRAEAASPTRARDFKAEAAEILHRRLNDGKRASDLYEQVLADDAAHPKATEALEILYSERKEWDSLVKLLEKKAQGQRGNDRVDTLCALAEVYEDRLQKSDEAAAQYEAALIESPRLVPALKGLERIYAQKGRYDALLKNLEAQLETVATPRQRIGIWERIGGIQEEEFVDHKAAATAYENIVAIEPGHDAANSALARVYRQLARFDELAATLERHALSSSDEPRKINLLLQAARVLTVDVGAPERAGNMAERVLSVKPDHPEALELLARLKAKSGDKNAAVDAVRKLAEAESDKAKKADFYVRAGRILEEAGDKDGAIAQYKLALDANKDDTNAASALRAVYASRGDAHGAADLLQREIDVTEGASKKAQLLAELGLLRRDRLKDDAGAKDAYKKALELDSTCTPAARGLGDIAFDAGDFAEAAKLYEPLLARTSEMSSEDALATCIRCGDALRNAKQYDKAQRAYLNAKSLAPTDREVLERVAEVTFDSGAADEAAELYRDLLKQGGKDLTGTDRGRIVWRLGDALRRSEQLDEAKTYLEEAAQLLVGQPEALHSLKELHAQKGEWEKVVSTLKRRIDVAPDAERFDLLVEQGDVLLGKLHDKARAGKSYVSALELRGDDRNLLSKLMAVYSETKDWGKLVEVILRIAELVSDKAQLAKYYNTAAAISHMELGRLDEAADYYEQALDLSAGLAKAFDGLVSALTQKQDWARLEKAYRDQLKRVESSATPHELAHLWDSLGELLKHRLNRPADAVEAFEKADKLEPENRRRSEQLAEIFAKEPKKFFAQAVRVHQQLLSGNPYRIESYQALRKLYTEAKKPDESWCVCQALTMLKNAEPDEEGFFKKHRRRQPAAIKEVLTDDLWLKHVQHPDQDPLLTDIFTSIAPAVFAVRSQPLATFKLDASQKRDAEKDAADLARTLWYAAQATRIPLPDLYYRDDDPGALGYVFSSPAAISLGKAGRAAAPSQVLAFLAGRHLAYLKGGMFLRYLVPTGSGLRAWLLASIKTQVAQFPIPGDLSTQVEEHMRAIQQHLPGPQKEVLRSHVNRLLASAPELDLKRWTAAVDLTADRVGFLLANDLEASTAIVKASPDEAAAVPQKDRLRELHLYGVSEPYLQLRHKLGIAIGD